MSGRLGAVAHAELGQDRCDVVADGFGAQSESGSDFGVAVPGGK